MSDGTITAYMAKHPKLASGFLTAFLIFSQIGIVAAGDGTIGGP